MELAVDGQVVPERLARMAGRQAQPDPIAQLGDAATGLEHRSRRVSSCMRSTRIDRSQRRRVSSNQ